MGALNTTQRHDKSNGGYIHLLVKAYSPYTHLARTSWVVLNDNNQGSVPFRPKKTPDAPVASMKSL